MKIRACATAVCTVLASHSKLTNRQTRHELFLQTNQLLLVSDVQSVELEFSMRIYNDKQMSQCLGVKKNMLMKTCLNIRSIIP